MKLCNMVGLVGAGGVNQSFVARMPALLGRLGPVKGSSLKVSRRMTNGFRAGLAVARYADFHTCGCIWMSVPEKALDRVAADLVREVPLRGKMVVLCDVLRDSQHAGPMRTAGARVATLTCVPESGEQSFVAEGHPVVIAELRRQLALDGRKLIELRPGKKSLFLLGVHMSAHLCMPWIAGAMESFRAAGFSRSQAARVVQALGTKALRAYGMAGVRAWNQAESERISRAIEADMEAIRLSEQWLAALHADGTERLRGLARKRLAKAAGKLSAKLVARKAS